MYCILLMIFDIRKKPYFVTKFKFLIKIGEIALKNHQFLKNKLICLFLLFILVMKKRELMAKKTTNLVFLWPNTSQ